MAADRANNGRPQTTTTSTNKKKGISKEHYAPHDRNGRPLCMYSSYTL